YSAWTLLFRALQVRKILKTENISVLHLHTARAGLLGCIAGLGLPIKKVYTGHSWCFEQKANVLQRALFYLYERFICYSANTVTFLTARDQMLGLNNGLVSREKGTVV